jgi:aryl-alcohol dehydrogenase-like predicted oxidoreductase
VQSTWNVLETSVGAALGEAAQAGAQVIVKEPVANGRLAPGGAGPHDGRARRVAELAASVGVPVDQLAIAAALARPWAWCVLSGAVHPDQLASNVAAADLALGAEVLAELDAVTEDPREYWTARSARSWS